MAYNLQTIRDLVKDRLSDENFSNALINQFINDEQRELFNYYDLPFNRGLAVHTLNQGDYTITLPADHQRTTGLRITAPDGYDSELTQWFIPFKRFKDYFREQEYYSETQPRYWTIYNSEIEFAYAVDKTYTIEHNYIATLDKLENDTDVPAVPEEFQEILVLGGLVRSLEVNDDNDIAQYQQGKKNLLVQALLKRYNPQQSGKTTVLRNTNRGI
jgi:hypothetical protein